MGKLSKKLILVWQVCPMVRSGVVIHIEVAYNRLVGFVSPVCGNVGPSRITSRLHDLVGLVYTSETKGGRSPPAPVAGLPEPGALVLNLGQANLWSLLCKKQEVMCCIYVCI